MDFLFITDQPDIAAFVADCGVKRIFIDLESLGKADRQAGRDSYISSHRMEQIAPVKAAIRNAELLVRVNPLHAGSFEEVESCLEAGADCLMLPMFRTARELDAFSRLVRDRAPVIPLVETAGAVESIADVVSTIGVTEIYVGLNDLHLDLKQPFMFQPLVDGTVDRIAAECHRSAKPFGFGGIARLGEGLLPPELILGEHVRLGSTWVILSRTFHRRATSLPELKSSVDLPAEIAKLQTEIARLERRVPHEIEADTARLRTRVTEIIAAKART